MSLFRRGRVWWCQIYRDGVRHQFSTGTANRKQAEAVEEKYKADLHATAFGIPNFDRQITVGALVAHFLAEGNPSIYHQDRIKQFLPYFSEYQALRLTRALLAEYRAARQAGGVTDATINRDLSVLRRILNWAVDQELIPANPLPRLRLARERRVSQPVMSVREEQLVLGACPDYLRPIVLMSLDTGLRKGECLHQRFEHIDFDRGVLSVTKSKTLEGTAREVPLTKRLQKALEEIRKPTGVAFMYQGQAIADIKKGWAAALRRAQVRHVRFHTLRHTFATRCAEAGVLPDVRMALLGHMPTNRVHARYVHIEIQLKRAAIAALEHWYQQQEQKLKGELNAESQNSNPADRPATGEN